jgi:hypothetical protein
LPANGDLAAAGQTGPGSVNDLPDIGGDAGQIAPLHAGEHVEHGLDIVMIDISGGRGTLQINQIAEQLRQRRGRHHSAGHRAG